MGLSEIKLTEDEREELERLFGWVPEPEPLEQMLAAVERILHDRLRGALKEAAKENVKRLQLESELRDMEIERNALRISLEGVLEGVAAERDHPSRGWNGPTARGEDTMLWGDWFRMGMDTAINTIRAGDA